MVDVTVISDDELKKNIITAPLQIIMRHIRDNDLLPIIKELAHSGLLKENAKYREGKLFLAVVNYVIRAGEISNRNEFNELLLEHSDEVRQNIMTILQQHQQEVRQGMQQGMQQGMRLRSFEIAKNMLCDQISMESICKFTDLTPEDVKKLKEELELSKH